MITFRTYFRKLAHVLVAFAGGVKQDFICLYQVVLPRSLGNRTSWDILWHFFDFLLSQQERTKTGLLAYIEVGLVWRLVLENRKLPNFKEHNTRSHFLRHVDE